MKNLFTIMLLLCCVTFIFGQQQNTSKNYDLKIGLSPLEIAANYSENMEYEVQMFDNQYFKIVQFYEHPTEEQKINLANSGVELIAYLPNYAWLVSFNENYNLANLNNYNVRAIIDIPREYKLSTVLQLEDYPNHILDGENVKLLVTFFNTVNNEKIVLDLTKNGFQILKSNGFSFIKEILVPINKINDFMALPYVQYIESILPEPTFDGGFVEDRSNERANYLASEQVGGLHYDGTGITIAVDEGGTVAAAVYNDFKGRLSSVADGSGVSSHKTGVAQRMGAYGNDDPIYTGMAFGANIISTNASFSYLVANTTAIAVNNSYGYGCYIGNYGSSGRSNDNLIRTNPTFMIAYSAGNIGDTDCSYGAGMGWGTTTGDVKQAKNVIAVGALNTSDNLMGFSSWGPAPDGRIKPDMCAVGPGGTSFACPNVVGGFGQLYHAYQAINGVLPNSGLIKGILQNTADDLGNPGPDFKYGYGRINMRRAYEAIANNTFVLDNVANGATDNHILNIPVGTKQVRIMAYWTDYEGTTGSSVALINNLNLTVTDPNLTVYNPWVLDHTINAVNLNNNATRAVDNLNNMEQVTIDNPISGNYTVTVNGASVPQGPQSYYLIYEFLEDEVTLTYPIGGEAMVAAENATHLLDCLWQYFGNF
ncbi:MAG: S8 family serine peptidase [Saprospiraceae bacterium]|nr:S8 family serine peptidase [Saprospiraceae bacterium]